MEFEQEMEPGGAGHAVVATPSTSAMVTLSTSAAVIPSTPATSAPRCAVSYTGARGLMVSHHGIRRYSPLTGVRRSSPFVSVDTTSVSGESRILPRPRILVLAHSSSESEDYYVGGSSEEDDGLLQRYCQLQRNRNHNRREPESKQAVEDDDAWDEGGDALPLVTRTAGAAQVQVQRDREFAISLLREWHREADVVAADATDDIGQEEWQRDVEGIAARVRMRNSLRAGAASEPQEQDVSE